MKVFCNECYQELEVHEYDNGFFVDVCECQEAKLEQAEKEAFDCGTEEGFDEGYSDGLSVADAGAEGDPDPDEIKDAAYEEGFQAGKDYSSKEVWNNGYKQGYIDGFKVNPNGA